MTKPDFPVHFFWSFSSFKMLTAFQQRGRLWMYKVEPEAMASGVHGFSEIVHLVFCEWGTFWEGQEDITFFGFS